jgi:hypothetical protein
MMTFQLLLSGDKDLIAKKIKFSWRTNMPLATLGLRFRRIS